MMGMDWTYLNVAYGKITHRGKSGRLWEYDYIRGYVLGITSKNLTLRGKTVPFRYLHLYDPDINRYLALAVGADSPPWRSLIYSLGSIWTFQVPVLVLAYAENGCSKLRVFQSGSEVRPLSDVPGVEYMQIDENIVRSTERRESFIETLIKQVNTICNNFTIRYEA